MREQFDKLKLPIAMLLIGLASGWFFFSHLPKMQYERKRDYARLDRCHTSENYFDKNHLDCRSLLESYPEYISPRVRAMRAR